MDFIDEKTEIFIEWLQNISEYPQVCYYAAQVIGTYIHQIYKVDVKIRIGFYKNHPQLAHVWLELFELSDLYTIDFTHGQFDKNEPYLIKKTKNTFEKLTPTAIMLFDEEIINFAKQANNFEDYLEAIRENISFENYKSDLIQGLKTRLLINW
jgi:hypothetical protein